MPIQKLEDSTVRTLGASQTLTDPTSLVKELIDNSLDAHATSIAIEISVNTLDVIQLRDNGYGIAPGDRAMVARPNCTSKTTTDNDIKSIRGTSLGFRGQALASAAELSGSMTINTRIEGEQTASSLVISQSGEVVDERRASHPVGTTVRITNFVAANPVRKQVLLKSTDKTLRCLKQLLRSYTFARPNVRFALRVIKSKTEKDNFLYVPKPDGTVEDVAMKLFGSACVDQCRISVVEANGMTLTALLPSATADMKRVAGVGHFIAVDGRPVSPKRGTLKQIVSMFRAALRAVNHASHNAKEIFLYLDIFCSDAAYDPNIEPAKDDVLFEDPDAVIATARTLLATFYETPGLGLIEGFSIGDTAGIEATMERDVVEQAILRPVDPSLLNRKNHRSILLPQTTVSSFPMSGVRHNGRDDVDTLLQFSTNDTSQELDELHDAHNNIQTSNPWILAKLNAPNRRPRATIDENCPPFAQADRYASGGQVLPRGIEMMTPHPSSPQPLRMPMSSRCSDHVDSRSYSPDAGVTSLESILQSSPSPHPVGLTPRGPESSRARPASTSQHECLGIATHADESRRRRPGGGAYKPLQGHVSSGPNAPFRPPARADDECAPLWFGRQANGTPAARSSQRSAPQRPRGPGLVQQGESDDTGFATGPASPPRHDRDIRDFVKSVDLTRDGELSMLSAIAARSDTTAVKQSTTGGVEHVNTATGTIRQCTNRPSRRISSGITTPLERTPAGKRMQNVFCRVNISPGEITASMGESILDASFRNNDPPPKGSIQDIIAHEETDYIVSKLRLTLLERISAGQLVGDFDKIVRDALFVRLSSLQFGEGMLI